MDNNSEKRDLEINENRELLGDISYKKLKRRNKDLLIIIPVIVFLLLVVIVSIVTIYNEFNSIRIISQTQDISEENAKHHKSLIDNIYIKSYLLKQTPRKQAGVYIPVYQTLPEEKAINVAKTLGFSETFDDIEDRYVFQNKDDNGIINELIIDKYLSSFTYKNYETTSIKKNFKKKITESEAINIIDERLESLDLDIKRGLYDYTAYDDGTKYIINLNLKIEELPLADFKTEARVLYSGELVYLETYYYSFEKIDSCRILPEEVAFYNLPTNLSSVLGSKDIPPDSSKNNDFLPSIFLTRCELIYVFSEGIIQPVYLYEGEINEDETLEFIINGADFIEPY